MLDVKFELVKKSFRFRNFTEHFGCWISCYPIPAQKSLFERPRLKKSKLQAQISLFERPVLMYSWSDLASSRTVWDNFFWSLTMFVFERSKTLYFCVRIEFFSKTVFIAFATDFYGTYPHTQKKKMNNQLNVVFKKQSLCWRWKEQNHFRLSQSYLRRLSGSTLHAKNEEISKFLYFVSFGKKFEVKLVETVFLSIRFKFKQTSYS